MDPVVTAVLEIVGMVAVVGLVFLPAGWEMRRRVGKMGLVAATAAVSVLFTVLAGAKMQAIRATNVAPPTRLREIAFFALVFVVMSACGALALEYRFHRDSDRNHRFSLRIFAWGLVGLAAGFLSGVFLFAFFGFEWFLG